jgi:trehalose-phosphatase
MRNGDVSETSSHPSNNPLPRHALEELNTIRQAIDGRTVAVFLDYDGTLAPIANHPELAVLDNAMHTTLGRLAHYCKVAIISGRALDDIKTRVDVPELFYSGNHGLEICGPTGSGIKHEIGEEFLPTLEVAHKTLLQKLGDIRGVLIENKRYSLSIHYRHTSPDNVQRIETAINETTDNSPWLSKHQGKLVFEIRPRLDWHKGKAILWLLQRIATEAESLPIFIGDDVTDEDAFRALRDSGIGVLVSTEPHATAARYWIRDVEEVRLLLEVITDIVARDAK